MSKQVKILLALVFAALAVYFIYTRKPWSSVKGGDETDFAIEDTASVTRVFIADGRNNRSLLERTENGWTVNGSEPADAGKVALMLETIHDVKLRNPVGQSEFNNVIKDLTAAGVKVEFYDADELIKTIYVGQMTSDQTGTYMMVAGASTPYVTHIPGFTGYLSPRFLPQPVKWRSRLIFDLAPEQITSVNVRYMREPAASFTVDNTGLKPLVKDGQGAPVEVRDSNFVKYYLAGFSQLHGEGYDEIYDRGQQDSIYSTVPYAVVTVVSKDGKSHEARLHLKPIERGTKDRYDEQGNLRSEDTERYLGFVNGSKEMLYIQHFNFGRVLRRAADFRGR